MHALTGTLPGGYWDADGTLHRHYELEPLTGREEEMLVQAGQRPAAGLVSELLARGVSALGEISPVNEQVTQQLLVGDRQFLLLGCGRRHSATTSVPKSSARGRTAVSASPLTFTLSDVPVLESSDKGPLYSMQLSEDATSDGDRPGHVPLAHRRRSGGGRWVAAGQRGACAHGVARALRRGRTESGTWAVTLGAR